MWSLWSRVMAHLPPLLSMSGRPLSPAPPPPPPPGLENWVWSGLAASRYPGLLNMNCFHQSFQFLLLLNYRWT